MQPYQISTSVLRDSVTTRKLRPLVHSMRVALTSLALAGPALTCIQQAQAQNTPVAEKTYAISAGPLSAALKAFAMAADITPLVQSRIRRAPNTAGNCRGLIRSTPDWRVC